MQIYNLILINKPCGVINVAFVLFAAWIKMVLLSLVKLQQNIFSASVYVIFFGINIAYISKGNLKSLNRGMNIVDIKYITRSTAEAGMGAFRRRSGGVD